MSAKEREPSIRFAGQEVPAHKIWDKTKMLYGVNEFLARLNQQMPDFASEQTIALVPEVQRRLKAIEVSIPKRFKATPELEKEARELLKPVSLDEALERFNANHAIDLPLSQFVELIGPRAYYTSLRNEAHEWRINKISVSQTADVWNELGRPAPGDPGGWTEKKVERLLSGGYT